ncbi:unnamed protein product [Symbiodinium microadriaticum]|nr:unnamed protein product [Symbiodinium microadriaticum]
MQAICIFRRYPTEAADPEQYAQNTPFVRWSEGVDLSVAPSENAVQAETDRQDSGYLMNMLLGFIDNFSLPGPTFRSIEAMKMAGPVFNAKCRLFRLDPYLSSAPHLSAPVRLRVFPALTGILVQVSLRFNLEPETMHEVEEVLRSLLSNPEAVKPLPTAYFVAVLSAICSFPIPKELPLRLVSSFLDREQMGQHTVQRRACSK